MDRKATSTPSSGTDSVRASFKPSAPSQKFSAPARSGTMTAMWLMLLIIDKPQ